MPLGLRDVAVVLLERPEHFWSFHEIYARVSGLVTDVEASHAFRQLRSLAHDTRRAVQGDPEGLDAYESQFPLDEKLRRGRRSILNQRLSSCIQRGFVRCDGAPVSSRKARSGQALSRRKFQIVVEALSPRTKAKLGLNVKTTTPAAATTVTQKAATTRSPKKRREPVAPIEYQFTKADVASWAVQRFTEGKSITVRDAVEHFFHRVNREALLTQYARIVARGKAGKVCKTDDEKIAWQLARRMYQAMHDIAKHSDGQWVFGRPKIEEMRLEFNPNVPQAKKSRREQDG